jgi:hypothetical protein
VSAGQTCTDRLNKPRGFELHQEAQHDSNLTLISLAAVLPRPVLLTPAQQRFRKQLFTVRDLGQDGRAAGQTRAR